MISIIMPVHNEVTTVAHVVGTLLDSLDSLQRYELIVVDDGSTDGTPHALDPFLQSADVHVLTLDRRRGKGAAVRAGIDQARGDTILLQDGDLELPPASLKLLLDASEGGARHAVYGSRFRDPALQPPGLTVWLEQLVTRLVNARFGARLTDVMTGQKLLPRAAVYGRSWRFNGFEWEVELTVHLLRSGVTIREIPVPYFPRTRSDGKKMRISNLARVALAAVTV